jgi:hypothetical protein
MNSFRIQNLNLPKQKGIFIQPIMAAEIISKGFNVSNQP